MSLPVAILAGGRATRLGELARTVPKSLIEVAGRPFLEHQLHHLSAQGYRDVVVCAGHLGDKIEDAIGSGDRWGMSIRYVHDGLTPLGTGGALRRALGLLGGTFLVQYGDSFLPFSFRQVEKALNERGVLAAMAVVRNDDQWDRSNVVLKDGLVATYTKVGRHDGMRHIDSGLLAFQSSAWDHTPDGPFDLADLLSELAHHGLLAGVEAPERFHEIGSRAGLEEAKAFLKGRKSAS